MYRYALYYAPEPESGWGRLAAEWLYAPERLPSALQSLRLPALVHDAARYGLHMTLKAPFRLAAGQTEAAVRQRLADFAGQRSAVFCGGPVLTDEGGFLALRPSGHDGMLQGLAADAVRQFDDLRAPLNEDDRQRRGKLPPELAANFERWGYPYVFGRFRPHVTLSGRGYAPSLADRLREWLAPHLPPVWHIGAVCLFAEREPGAAFIELARFPLTGGALPIRR
jgi:2'-5' RNA ligase